MNTEITTLTEQHISELVRRFYLRASADDSLRIIFEAAITDWDAHHRVVENFWSHALLNTDRYQGSPYRNTLDCRSAWSISIVGLGCFAILLGKSRLGNAFLPTAFIGNWWANDKAVCPPYLANL
jgi:hypothetical protein